MARDGSRDDADATADAVAYDPASSPYDIFECPECDNRVLSVGTDDPPMSCHGEPMDRVTDCDMRVRPPELREVLLDAFGLPRAGIDICLCVIGEGPVSANEVADTLGYDRSTVTRYLNELVEMGLLRRTELNREGGGIVNAYHSVDLDRMRRDTLVGFYVWAGEAATLIEEANLTKRDYLSANPDEELPAVFWEEFGDE